MTTEHLNEWDVIQVEHLQQATGKSYKLTIVNVREHIITSPDLWSLNLDATIYRLVTLIREQMEDSPHVDLTIHLVFLEHLFIEMNCLLCSGYLRTRFPFKYKFIEDQSQNSVTGHEHFSKCSICGHKSTTGKKHSEKEPTMLKHANEQGLVSLTVPPCCWNLQLIHYWEPYVNLTKGIRGQHQKIKKECEK